jgi:hypothetical protein
MIELRSSGSKIAGSLAISVINGGMIENKKSVRSSTGSNNDNEIFLDTSRATVAAPTRLCARFTVERHVF